MKGKQAGCRGEYNNLAETGLQSWFIYTAADEADKGVERLQAPPKGLYKTSTFPRLRELKTYTVHWQTMAILPTQRPSTGRLHHLRPSEVCDEGTTDEEPSQVPTLPGDEVGQRRHQGLIVSAGIQHSNGMCRTTVER